MLFAEFYFRFENRTHRKISIRPIIIINKLYIIDLM